ncbi:MAG: hypothetical protein KC441_09275 [Anaerolineales bacterium]|nr:hypothetical protein [Anaerolineales bacterium]
MQALRFVQTPKDGKIIIELPAYLRSQPVEVIVLAGVEAVASPEGDARQFRGTLRLDRSVEEIEDDLRTLRDEWDRHI